MNCPLGSTPPMIHKLYISCNSPTIHVKPERNRAEVPISVIDDPVVSDVVESGPERGAKNIDGKKMSCVLGNVQVDKFKFISVKLLPIRASVSESAPVSKPKMSNSTPKNVRPLNRFITTHDESGKAIFSNTLSEEMPVNSIADGADFSLAYTTSNFPANLNNDTDITDYKSYLSNPPGITISTGTVCRIVDMQPNALSPMHRTVSLDYGVVLEGEVELVLDSGEVRLLKRGDVAVQRGTNHAWRNVTPDVEGVPQWARMLYVLSPSQPMTIGGLDLGEVVDGIGVRAST